MESVEKDVIEVNAKAGTSHFLPQSTVSRRSDSS